MEVTETTNDGVKREFRVTLPATDLDARVVARLTEMKDQVRINGFRPGKVPVDHLRKVYGRAVMAETIDGLVKETNARIVSDHGLKLALDPKVTLPEDQHEVEQVLAGKADLSYTVAVEVVPKIELADFKLIKLERLTVEVGDDEVDDAVRRVAEQNRTWTARPEGAKAETGDRVTATFKGTVDGEPLPDGGDTMVLQLGSKSAPAELEDGLVGIAAGETRAIEVPFPATHYDPKYAGRTAVYEVAASAVESGSEVVLDDALAASVGVESLEKLRQIVRDRIAEEYAGATRHKLKRKLLDRLDELHRFESPPSLVEHEFANVWGAVENEMRQQNRSFEDEDTTEEKAREDYRAIADRRVRLGLVLADIAERNNITVSDEEVSRAIVQQVRQYPGREREMWDHYQKNPGAVAAVRAPLFEEKVVDFLVELADVTEKKVSREEFLEAQEDDDKMPAR